MDNTKSWAFPLFFPHTYSPGLSTLSSNHQSWATALVHRINLCPLVYDQLKPGNISRISCWMQRSPGNIWIWHMESMSMISLPIKTTLKCSNPPSFGITDINNTRTNSLQQKSSRNIMSIYSAYRTQSLSSLTPHWIHGYQDLILLKIELTEHSEGGWKDFLPGS